MLAQRLYIVQVSYMSSLRYLQIIQCAQYRKWRILIQQVWPRLERHVCSVTVLQYLCRAAFWVDFSLSQLSLIRQEGYVQRL